MLEVAAGICACGHALAPLSGNVVCLDMKTHDLPVECCEAVKPAVLQKWLDHTQTPQEVQMDIVRQMEREITGGEKTDFAPYYRDGKIQFDH